MNRLRTIAVALIAFALFQANAFSADIIGVSTFENRSDKEDYDYLSKILPNSIAASIESNYKLKTLKPGELETILTKKKLGPPKSSYTDHELPEFVSAIGVDYFLYGYFKPLEGNKIEISISIYDKDTLEVFTFKTIGRMETEIFNLVDQLTEVMNEFIGSDHIYKETEITANSKIAFITNLEAEELNMFYSPFLDSGYSIISTQANEIENHLFEDPMFEKLKHLTLKSTAFERVTTGEKQVFTFSPGKNRRELIYEKSLKDLIKKYHYSYSSIQESSLKKLATAYKFNIDYLFVVMFDEKRKEAWLRCFELKRFDTKLVWLQSGIRAKGESSNRVINVSTRIRDLFKKDEQPKKKK